MVLVRTMVRALLLTALCAPFAHAEFSLTIANPVAARIRVVKKVGMAVRAEGCADPAHVKLTVSAVRLEGGTRVTMPIAVVQAEQPGVFGVGLATGPGRWLYVLAAECGTARAGALVPPDDRGFPDRDHIRQFPHAPTDADIGAALK